MPEVGSQWSVTANRMMPLIAIQKSGALAPEQRQHRGDAVEQAAGAVGGERADHDRERQGQAHGDAGELERRRHGFQHQLERRPALADRFAEIAGGEVAEEAAELHDQGIAEAVLVAELLPGLDRGVDRQIEIGGIAGQPGEEEDGDDQPRERYQALQRALRYEAAHRSPGLTREVSLSIAFIVSSGECHVAGTSARRAARSTPACTPTCRSRSRESP